MKILIIGVGGIGSFLIRELNKLILNEQINLKEIDIDVTDFDKVEIKNIKYQNFPIDDLMKYKTESLEKRYKFFNYLNKEIKTEEQLKEYDMFICCVDNAKTRKLIIEHSFKEDKYFIDLRSEGRAIAIFTKTDKSNKEELLKTLGDSKENKSCQLEYELENNIIQNGNIIVSTIGSQLLLNKLRKENNQEKYLFYF